MKWEILSLVDINFTHTYSMVTETLEVITDTLHCCLCFVLFFVLCCLFNLKSYETLNNMVVQKSIM